MTSSNVPSVPEPTPEESTALTARDSYALQSFDDFRHGEESGVHWRRYVAAVLRYKWLILLLVIGGTAAGFGLTRLIAPEFVAFSTIWIETDEEGEMGPIRSEELLQPQAWSELLQSQAVLEPVVIERRLYLEIDSPRDSAALAPLRITSALKPDSYALILAEDGKTFTFATSDGEVLQRGRVGEPVGRDVGLDWTPAAETLVPGGTVEFTVWTPGEAAVLLSERLEIGMDGKSNFLRIALEGNDPREVAATLNEVAEQFVTVAGELKRAKLEALTAILSEQLEYAEENLQGAEAALESFRVQTITLPSDRATPVAPGLEITQDPVFSSFFEMRFEQQQLRRDRDAIQQALNRASRSELSVGALQAIPAVNSSPELVQALSDLTQQRAQLRALQYRYTNEHPQVQQAMQNIETLEGQSIPQLASALVNNIDARLGQLGSRLSSASSELREIPTRTIEEQRLVRERESAENLYKVLLSRFEESRLAEASAIPDVSILDEARIPRSPTNQDGQVQIILMALIGSLGVGVLGSILLDRADPRLRYPEQVTNELGLNILGAIPHAGDDERLGSGNGGQVIEAFREVRLNMMHAYGAAGPHLVTITSPGVGDGKSFIASNLALAFADQGYRTLLIDGDIRRGGLHRLFKQDRKPGLTDYLAGRASREDVVRKTSYATLDLLPCGTRMKGGPELLGTPAMTRLLVEMRSLYQVILIDSPPLGAGVDPFALGTASGNLLLVLRTGNTNRELAEAKLDLLDRLPVRVLGAVLNDVPSRGVYRYYTYLSGYEAHDERLGESVGRKQLQSA